MGNLLGLVQPLIGMIGGWLERRNRIAEARAQAEIQRATAADNIEAQQVDSLKGSWKDEVVTLWVLFIFTWPLFSADAIGRLERLSQVPEWLQVAGLLVMLRAVGITMAREWTQARLRLPRQSGHQGD